MPKSSAKTSAKGSVKPGVPTARRFTRSFYRQDPHIVAKALLGAYLHRVSDGVELIGKIVETEAYAQYDPACHAYRGITPRTRVLFGDGGYSYVYFTYGMHWCFNVSTNEEGVGAAVLVRGVEPIQGIELMRVRRPKARKDYDLTNGPGKLCQAFALGREENGIDLVTSQELFISKGEKVTDDAIGVSTRIGISVGIEYDWRFYVKDNPFVSRGKPSVLKPT